MPKITLTQLSTFDNTNVSSLNDSLQKIEDALNENVLYRDNITGEPNQAEQEYDMNSFRIINLAEPVNNSDAARLIDIQSGGGDTVTSFEGRTGDVTAESGDYTTDQVTEGTNLYYTSSRVQNDAPVTSVASKTGAVSINPSDIEQEGATDGQVMTWDNTAGQWEPQASGGAPVDSVFGRTGAVVAAKGDYDITDLGQTSATDGQTIRWSDFNNQWEPAAPGAAPVDSVFGRIGFVTAQSGDYTTDQVSEAGNLYHTTARASAAAPVQDVAGKTGNVTISPSDLEQQSATDGQAIAWNNSAGQWEPADIGGDVSSVFGRTGAVTAQSGDYNTDQVTEGSNLYFTDARAQAAVDVPVDSVFGRTGDILAQAGDYSATKITVSDTAGNFSSSNVEDALKELAQTGAVYTTPEEFGAVGDGSTDDLSAFNSMFTSLESTGGVVLLGNKEYMLSGRPAYSSQHAVSIIGVGAGLSRLTFTNATSGIDITVNDEKDSGPAIYKDFGLYADTNCNGPALSVKSATENTGVPRPSFSFENIKVKYRLGFSATGRTWAEGFYVESLPHARFDDCFAFGKAENGSTGSNQSGHGFRIAGACTPGPVLVGCRAYRWFSGISKPNTVDDLTEGIDIVSCTLVANEFGVLMDMSASGGQPGLQITGGHNSSVQGNIVLDSANQCQVNNVLLYRRPQSTAPFYDVDINNCIVAKVQGNISGVVGGGGTSTVARVRDSSDVTISDNTVQGGSRENVVDIDSACIRVSISGNNGNNFDFSDYIINAPSNTVRFDRGDRDNTLSVQHVSNIASSNLKNFFYSRVGNVVHFSGKIEIQPDTTSTAEFRIAPPISTNFGDTEDAAGNITKINSTGFVRSNNFTNDLEFVINPTNTNNAAWYFTGMYEVR